LYRSLQIAMIGTLLFAIVLIRSATPPRSPALIPSTSSMMRARRRRRPDASTEIDAFVESSLTALAVLPPTPLAMAVSACARIEG
jgi:hypothetical protein